MKKRVVVCALLVAALSFTATWGGLELWQLLKPTQAETETHTSEETIQHDPEKQTTVESVEQIRSEEDPLPEQGELPQPPEQEQSEQEQKQTDAPRDEASQETVQPDTAESSADALSEAQQAQMQGASAPQQTQTEETTSEPETEAAPDTVQSKLEEFSTTYANAGTWDLCYQSLSDPADRAAVGPGTPMVSASVIKLFIMAAVYDQVEQGNLSRDSIYQSVYHMITVSDNYSTNQLITTLGNGNPAEGMVAVNAYATSIGCSSSKVERLMLAENGLQNYTTAADCAKLLQMIYNGTCVSETWSAEMLQILKEQTVRNRIPAGLPAGTVCANKTGDLIRLCCADVGIVFSPGGDYILCTICNEVNNDVAAVHAMAELSSDIYEMNNP